MSKKQKVKMGVLLVLILIVVYVMFVPGIYTAKINGSFQVHDNAGSKDRSWFNFSASLYAKVKHSGLEIAFTTENTDNYDLYITCDVLYKDKKTGEYRGEQLVSEIGRQRIELGWKPPKGCQIEFARISPYFNGEIEGTWRLTPMMWNRKQEFYSEMDAKLNEILGIEVEDELSE